MKRYSQLKADVRRQWRRVAREEMERRGMPIPADFREEMPGDGDLHPPEAGRVARRATCLAAVGLRGLASSWSHEDQQDILPRLAEWVRVMGLEEELEASELEAIDAPASELDQRGAVKACWRWEGAAVLAASLGRMELPPHDGVVDTQTCGDACALLRKPADVAAFWDGAAFDPGFDRFAMADQMLAIHWRLRQFLQMERKPLDFAAYAKKVEWATFNLRGVRLLERDLAIGDVPIFRADDEHLGMAMSIASERHLAANWLIGWDAVYSEVECPT